MKVFAYRTTLLAAALALAAGAPSGQGAMFGMCRRR